MSFRTRDLEQSRRWEVIAAWAALAGGLGPVIWRLHMLAWGAGWSEAPLYRQGEGLVYVVTLMLVEAAAAAATLGLVLEWGRRWPSWVPRLGGRPLRPHLVLTTAITGAVLLTTIMLVTAWTLISLTLQGISNPMTQVHGWHRVFLYLHYIPSLLWPVGLWAATVGYAQRARR